MAVHPALHDLGREHGALHTHNGDDIGLKHVVPDCGRRALYPLHTQVHGFLRRYNRRAPGLEHGVACTRCTSCGPHGIWSLTTIVVIPVRARQIERDVVLCT